MSNNIAITDTTVQNKIYTIRNLQVMLDRDLAELYGVETRVLNQALKRNIERFDDDFMFQLSEEELEILKSQTVISSSNWGGLRKAPFVFTEQGVYMLATVLKSKTAVEVTKQIMRTFTSIKSFLQNNSHMFQRFENIEYKLVLQDKRIEKIFETIENKDIKPMQGIFFDGQIFDAYSFINDLFRSANVEIILIDNYVDDRILTLFSKYSDINFTIVTKSVSKQLKLDIDKYTAQYKNLTIKRSNQFHDRFLLIDNTKAYHIGASLKVLGKKIFAFNQIDINLLKGDFNAK